MTRQRSVLKTALPLVALAFIYGSAPGAQEITQFEGWDLEPGVAQAHLVMVARVTSVSSVTVVEGAKTDVALREYRFQPIRRLKGIFQRDELSMTASDLGLPAEDASSPPPLAEGEFRLLILAQRPQLPFGTMGCVSAAPGASNFEQRVPLLSGPDDPLVSVVDTLIQVTDSRSRQERAKMLLDRLLDAEGRAAVPLLSSLQRRADWVALDDRAYAPLARLALDQSTAVRGAALVALRDVLAAHVVPEEPGRLELVAETLRDILESEEPVTWVRLAALDALGNLLALESSAKWSGEFLLAQLTGAATYAERLAAATALSKIESPEALSQALDALRKLPLDESPTREADYFRAIMRLQGVDDARESAGGASELERALIDRLTRAIEARQSIAAEVAALGTIRSVPSLPLLLAAAEPSVSKADQQHIARALGELGDDQAVPVLADWMRGDDYGLKESALVALETIDSHAAAVATRPLLKSEARLAYKLRLARLLARHGFADGYPLATEHLADAEHTASAALVLAALNDPRTEKDLSAILEARPDRQWRAAALTGLAAVGDRNARTQLLEILEDDRHPLAADAAAAAGLAANARLLAPLAELTRSRNERVALSSLVALRRFLSGVRLSPRGLVAAEMPATAVDQSGALNSSADVPIETRRLIADAVASLAADAYVDAKLRHQALAVAQLLGGRRYAALLAELSDQAELEGSRLMEEVRAERRRLRSSGDQG